MQHFLARRLSSSLFNHGQNKIRLRAYFNSSKIKFQNESLSFPALIVGKDKQQGHVSLTVKDLLELGISSRDILPLHLTNDKLGPETDTSTREAFILPRENQILVSLGCIKAILSRDSMIVFDAHLSGVEAWVNEFLGKPSPPVTFFYIHCLEEILILLCEMFERRMRLVGPLKTDLSSTKVHYQTHIDASVHLRKATALQDSLSLFADQVSRCENAIATILHTAEDFDAIIAISESVAGPAMRLDVERMLERYASRLSLITQHIKYDIAKLTRRQQAAVFFASVQRTKLLQLNLNISIFTLTLSTLSAMAGIFGMNLHSGLEQKERLFYVALLVMLASASGIHTFIRNAVSKNLNVSDLEKHEAGMNAIQRILADSGSLDLAIKEVFRAIDETDAADTGSGSPEILTGKLGLSREDFKKLFLSTQNQDHLTSQHTDALFDLLDSDHDGLLQKNKIEKSF